MTILLLNYYQDMTENGVDIKNNRIGDKAQLEFIVNF